MQCSMAKLVRLHRAESICENVPDERHAFPCACLKAAESDVGAWAVYHEPLKAGPRGYFAVAKTARVIPKPGAERRFLAIREPGSQLVFDTAVPRLQNGRPREAVLAGADGLPRSGGALQNSVRPLPEAEFAAILGEGQPFDLAGSRRGATTPRRIRRRKRLRPSRARPIERLVNRPSRDVAFRRKVREDDGDRCAMSGLRLRNDGGQPEVNAAHIRPVERQGSDAIRNGLALSGMLHWIFDRGLIRVANDHSLPVPRVKVPRELSDRLVVLSGRLVLPGDPRDWPHSDNLRWHRETVFGQVALQGMAPWE